MGLWGVWSVRRLLAVSWFGICLGYREPLSQVAALPETACIWLLGELEGQIPAVSVHEIAQIGNTRS